MTKGFCKCYYKPFIDYYISTWSTVCSFIITMVIIFFGVFFNYKFVKKLKSEKRATPIGRKGNVIEPIMRWFLIIQIVYWPYQLLFIWIIHNGIFPADMLPTWLCYGLHNAGVTGRTCVAYNSLLIALIRYIYIVHHPKANQWNFEAVGRRFQIISVTIPVITWLLMMFTTDDTWLKQKAGFKECVALYNDGKYDDSMKSDIVEWTLKYLPELLVSTVFYITRAILIVVSINIIEAFLYFKIFQQMKR